MNIVDNAKQVNGKATVIIKCVEEKDTKITGAVTTTAVSAASGTKIDATTENVVE